MDVQAQVHVESKNLTFLCVVLFLNQ